MATPTTDLKAMRQQIQSQIREHEVAIRNLQDSIRLLDNLPDILQGKAVAPDRDRLQIKVNTQNTNMVRAYLDTYNGTDALDVSKIVKHLQAQGVHGTYRSIYSQVHVILRKESLKGERIQYVKGRGFFKKAGAGGEA